MRKKYFFLLIIAIVISILATFTYLIYNKRNTVYPEDATTINAKITNVLFFEEEVMLEVIQEGKKDKDQIWLQKDTSIFDENGDKLEFDALKEGQSIRATTDSTVLYANPQVDTLEGSTSNIFWRCYDVTILEKDVSDAGA